MIRNLLKALVLVILLVAAGAFFYGYRFGGGAASAPEPAAAPPPTATTGRDVPQIDVTKARERAAAVGEKVAVGANKAAAAVEDGALTAKIKAKMTLDDLVRARDINVDTVGGTVTLTGTVHSEAERERAVRLAKETNGVTSVVNRLQVR